LVIATAFKKSLRNYAQQTSCAPPSAKEGLVPLFFQKDFKYPSPVKIFENLLLEPYSAIYFGKLVYIVATLTYKLSYNKIIPITFEKKSQISLIEDHLKKNQL